MKAPRTRPGVRSYLGAFGQVLGEILFMGFICLATTGALVAVEAHPYVSTSVASSLVAGSVILLGRRSAKLGFPWTRRRYVSTTLMIAAVVGAMFLVAISLKSVCCP